MSQNSKSAQLEAKGDEVEAEPLPKVSPMKEISVPAKVIVQTIKSPSLVKLLQQSKPSLPEVTHVQQQQEAWTNKVLEQSQQTKLTTSQQRVKTERIEPYVSGQGSIYTNQLQAENGKQLFCTIVSSTNSSKAISPQRQMKVNRQTLEKKQQQEIATRVGNSSKP